MAYYIFLKPKKSCVKRTLYIEANDSVTLNVTISNGTNLNVAINFGDNSSDEFVVFPPRVSDFGMEHQSFLLHCRKIQHYGDILQQKSFKCQLHLPADSSVSS